MKPLVFNLPAQVPYNGSSICYGCCLHAKTRAAVELASLLTRSPPMTRRAVVVWWTKVCHHIHLLLGSE